MKKDIDPNNLLQLLLKNRGLKTKQEQDAFLHPDLALVISESVGIDRIQKEKALKRIRKAVASKEQIIIFGDYDVDGIAGTAILWETLHGLGAQVMPYIPDRVSEGYGLSIKAIQNVILNLFQDPKKKMPKQVRHDKRGLIITVDNGIVANSAVEFAHKNGIDVIITDHHVPGKLLPQADAIFHTTKLCGTGVAWMLSKEIPNPKSQIPSDHLALVALATVADLVPLTTANRTLLIEGLKVLHETKRPGIVAMCEEAAIDQKKIGVYEIGHMIAPRLNAMGRIASAMDSLRLLCTKDRLRAKVLAEKLGITNKERKDVTKKLSLHAIETVKSGKTKYKDLLIVYGEMYEEGVIGLVAGRLVETFYRPSIVIAIGKTTSKASARSIPGFNVIEFIRKAEHLLINAGGHPMAAGFTIATENIGAFEKFLGENLAGVITDGLFVKSIKIDCELPLSFITQKVYDTIQQLSPFGMSNPEPTFLASAKIISLKQVGKEKNHLSLLVTASDAQTFSAIAFGRGEEFEKFKKDEIVDIVYTIDEHEWQSRKNLQLKIKDIQLT